MEKLLATKLYTPKSHSVLVPRPRLMEKLNAGLHRKLTLVTAPAGFGKTTLVAEWANCCAGLEQPVQTAWLSLDEEDGGITRFLTYLIAALQKVAANTGGGVLTALQSPQPPSAEMVLTTLINEIASVADPFILVLDDYHLIDSKPVDSALSFLLNHLPSQMHLVIISREDPNLPLARLRARGQLSELRVADLYFTLPEAAEFFTQAMGLSLSENEIASLEARTEGWIAGLQLAALALQGMTSLKGQKDTPGFIRSFTGSHHFVMDYLVEEVLEQQSESIQTFLLCTSILDHMCSPLCDAVLLDPSISGQATLEYLEQANLFLIPLDNERWWYRYHHLFADLLRKRLRQLAQSAVVFPNGAAVNDLSEYHRRASVWYEEQGLAVEAFHHAVEARDVDRAACLLQGEGMPLHFRGAMAPVLKWLDSLPVEILDARPSLWVTYITALTMAGKPVRLIEKKLQPAEAALQRAAPDDKTRDLLGQIAAIRAMLAVPQNQVDVLFAQSRRALEYLHPENLPVRTTAAWTLGYAYQIQGDRAEAIRIYNEVLSTSQASGNTMMRMAAATCLGQVQEADNQLHLAAETYQSILQLAGDPPLPGACEAHLGLARISYQWNDLKAAQQHGQQSLQLARQLENVDTPALSMVILGDVKLAQGDAAGAAALFFDAERFIRRHPSMHRLPNIATARVRYLIHQGDLQSAAELAKVHELPISQARIYLSQGDSSTALAILDSLRSEAETRDWPDECLTVMVLQAIALMMQGEAKQAVQVLKAAIGLAEPDGLVRIFIDEGPPMAELLQAVARQGTASDYVRQLLAAFGERTDKAPIPQPGSGPAIKAPLTLADPLSERELDVLRLLRTYLTGPEIAQELMVSLNTMRTHTKNIYNKLGVNNRQAAVRRADELHLL
ncbi:MAG: LuxR C-terminal-related transcriptional regulator [Anaerolineaceae bacterium]|nr:LuxR C-terminal-related transcriptional regulator [Anaerolineaceae bacterium]